MTGKTRVALIGSGNWGSAIARIIGKNVARYDDFEEVIKMYVYEEQVNGRNLSEIINTEHENVKYLPGKKLPKNIVANTDLVDTARDADILVWVIPHQLVEKFCTTLKGHVKPNVISISLIKGFYEKPGAGVILISKQIEDTLGCPTSVLMGANIANEVAEDTFCETTIGCADESQGQRLKKLFHTENFLVTVVKDVKTVECCGALKNIVACAVGFAEGIGLGDNAKAAVQRLGLKDMIKFCGKFYPKGFDANTFFESCGVADLVATCAGGRNARCAKKYAELQMSGQPKTLEQLEKEMLNGQKLQGPATAEEVHIKLAEHKCVDEFPVFVAVYLIGKNELKVQDMVTYIKNHAN